MTDTIMLGKLGETALSASALANQFISIFQICCMGIGMGASVLTSRFWGMQDKHSLRKAVTIMLRLCFIFGLAFTLATILAPEGLMRIYTSDPAIIQAGASYFRWSIPCYWLLGFSLTCTIVLRSVGQVKLPLICSICAFFINVFFNYLFIFGAFGAPRMEVAGAALGTVIARVFEFCFICGYFLFVDKRVAYRLKHLTMKCRDLVGDYLRISIPCWSATHCWAWATTRWPWSWGGSAPPFVAANSITTVTQQLSTVFIQGISNASSIITGPHLGPGRVRQGPAPGLHLPGLGAVIGVLAGLLIMAHQRTSDLLLRHHRRNPADRRAADAGRGLHRHFPVYEFHLDKGRASGRRRHQIPDGCRHPVPVGGLCASGSLGGSGVASARLLDLHLPEDRPDHQAVWCVFRLSSKKWIKRIEAK